MILSGAAAVLFFGTSGPLPDFKTFTPFYVHGTTATILIALVCVHVLAALYHQFVVKDRLLARMGLGRVG